MFFTLASIAIGIIGGLFFAFWRLKKVTPSVQEFLATSPRVPITEREFVLLSEVAQQLLKYRQEMLENKQELITLIECLRSTCPFCGIGTIFLNEHIRECDMCNRKLPGHRPSAIMRRVDWLYKTICCATNMWAVDEDSKEAIVLFNEALFEVMNLCKIHFNFKF